VSIAVIGRIADTEAARGWPGHAVLPAAGWSLDGNLAFVRDIVQARRAIYVASPICRDNLVDERGALTMFGWELALLSAAGFVRAGDFLLPPDPFCAALAADPVAFYARIHTRATSGDVTLPELRATVEQMALLAPALAGEAQAVVAAGLPYAPAVRLAARFAALADEHARVRWPGLPVVFQPKVAAELEPLLALFPDVIAFPTFAPLDADFFVATRVVPVHPLGLVAAPLYSDGAVMSPLEYFLHDVDHARFMLREDLLSRGVALADAYQGTPPTTLVDARLNLHRTILDGAAPAVVAAGLAGRERLDERSRYAARFIDAADLPSGTHARALSLLLFEILHEKGFPFDGAVLRREVAGDRHVGKLGDKLRAGFFGRMTADAETIALLDWARGWVEARA
jgi:hypothetical protein